ncbi:transposase [Nocardia sp. CA-084685]|uniref:transposase n=1 Tax=Nocardia sp. CA-084685 TaxID=3239970 RepID=UPI003D9733BE
MTTRAPRPIAVRTGRHTGAASFADACTGCPLRAQCTTAVSGRTVTIGSYEKYLATARARQLAPTGRRLPRHPAQGGTQDQPPDAPPPRWTPRPYARTGQDRRRLSACSPPRITLPHSPSSESATPASGWTAVPA